VLGFGVAVVTCSEAARGEMRHSEAASAQLNAVSLIRRRPLTAAALCVASIAVWLLAAVLIDGVAASVLILAAWAALLAAGWLSAWSLPFVAVAPALGELSDRAGWESKDGDITNLGAALFIAMPVAVALILIGVATRTAWRSHRRRTLRREPGD
jgi:hypothetical protein